MASTPTYESLGAGVTDATTTRVVAASDSPDVAALGTPADAAALDGFAANSVVALLKAQQVANYSLMNELLTTLQDIRDLLANMR